MTSTAVVRPTVTDVGSVQWGAREQALRDNLGLVQHVLRRLGFDNGFPPVLDRDDLFSLGTVGLLEAIDRYDSSKGVSFYAYATIRIRGAVLDGIRAVDPLPRGARQRSRSIDQSWSELASSLGREPTAQEVCAASDLTMESYRETLSMLTRLPVALDTSPVEGESTWLRDMESESQFQNIERAELVEDLAEAVRQLPERELLIISLYYQEGLRLREIGLILGVSESRVNQLHARAVGRLRETLNLLYTAA